MNPAFERPVEFLLKIKIPSPVQDLLYDQVCGSRKWYNRDESLYERIYIPGWHTNGTVDPEDFLVLLAFCRGNQTQIDISRSLEKVESTAISQRGGRRTANSFTHAEKMRSSVSHYYAIEQDEGVDPLRFTERVDGSWSGNPSLSDFMAQYMKSPKRRKVSTDCTMFLIKACCLFLVF
jgi:hypothetical protein